MEQKNSNFEYKTIVDKIEYLLKNIEKSKEENNTEKYKWKESFEKDSITCKNLYSHDMISQNEKQKYQYLYLFLAERNNKKLQKYESNNRKLETYNKRLKLVSFYLKTIILDKKSERDAIKERYAIQGIIQAEIINHYRCLIEEKKCDKKMQQAFIKYLDYLKSINDSEYDNYANKTSDINEIEMEQHSLEEELQELMEFLKSQTLEINKSKYLDLIQNDIIKVLYDICPTYKKMIDEKKGKSIN